MSGVGSSSSSRKRPACSIGASKGGGGDEGKGPPPPPPLKTTGLEADLLGLETDPNECAICLEAIEIEGSLDGCSHVFCEPCILEWAKTETRCPCCRKRFHTVSRIAADDAAAAASSKRRSSSSSRSAKRRRVTKTKVETRDQGQDRHRLTMIDGGAFAFFPMPLDFEMGFLAAGPPFLPPQPQRGAGAGGGNGAARAGGGGGGGDAFGRCVLSSRLMVVSLR